LHKQFYHIKFQYAQALGSGARNPKTTKRSTNHSNKTAGNGGGSRSNFFVDDVDGDAAIQETGEVVKTEFSSK